MSGRSGYRKGNHPLLGRFGVRRGPRTPAFLLPDWRLTFVIPPAFSFVLPQGPFPGFIGVSVGDLGEINVVGKNRQWVLAQAASFLKHIGRDAALRRLTGRLVREPERGPTISGPPRPGEQRDCVIQIDDDWIVINGTAMRQATFPTSASRRPPRATSAVPR